MGASNQRPRDAPPPPPRIGRWGSAASETGGVVSGHMWLPDEGTRSPTSQISAQRLWLYDQGSRSPLSQTTAQKIHQNCKSPSQDGGVRVKFAYKTQTGVKTNKPIRNQLYLTHSVYLSPTHFSNSCAEGNQIFMVIFLFTGYSCGNVSPEISLRSFDVVVGGGVGRVFKCWREGDKGLGLGILAFCKCGIHLYADCQCASISISVQIDSPEHRTAIAGTVVRTKL